MDLSTARAGNVFIYFVEKKGLRPNNIEVAGRGEFSPLVSNSSKEGRSKNRRIEIKIYTA
jgi:chemotaxis protein MotB